MTRYESFTHTTQQRITRRIVFSSAVRILNFIRHCFAYTMNGKTTRMVRRWNYRNYVNSVLLFYSQFWSNRLSVISGRRLSFITIASIGFLKWFTTDFLHFNSCILPSIIRHILLHHGIRVWRCYKATRCYKTTMNIYYYTSLLVLSQVQMSVVRVIQRYLTNVACWLESKAETLDWVH